MAGKPKVLLADDEEAITAPLADMLELAGYAVATARDGPATLDQARKFFPDLIVLDVRMPRLSGHEVLRRLREEGNRTPVILLTRVKDRTARVTALDDGADDYITKPYDPHELLARIRAVLRRAGPQATIPLAADVLVSDGLVLDRRSRRVFLDGREVRLTPKAVALLEYLMGHPDEVFTREQLLDAVWGWADSSGTRAVDIRVAELRRKLGDDAAHPRYIETIPATGYRFRAPVEVGR